MEKKRTLERAIAGLLVLALALAMLPLGGAPAVAQGSAVYINEIEVSTTSTDWEFFELQGVPGTDLSDLTFVGIESDAGDTAAGTIDRAISLAGQAIPADGFWLGISPAGAATYGVAGEMSIADNTFENSTATYFLVSGFTGSAGDDLDTDDDGVLDSEPWAAVLDAINIRDADAGDFDYGVTSVGPDGSYLPAGTYRCPDAPDGGFDNNMLNFSTPDGTPGVANCAAPLPEVYINEIEVSTTSTDWEFFELQGVAGTDLSSLTLVGVESDATAGPGSIDRVISLAGQAIPGDGFWLGISPAGAAAYGVAGEMSIADNSFENSTATYFLVSGFTGAQGDDLDTDDDGVLDSEPWAAVLDAINIRDADAGDFDYGATSVGPDGPFLPAGTYRCPDAPDGSFDANMLNFSTPDGTPGTGNNCAPPPPPAVYINEFSASTTGTDVEYVEVYGDPNTDYSAYTILEIEGDDGGAGVVDEVIAVGTTDANGFYLVDLPANALENGTISLLLVKDFTGGLGNDLDTDNDGALDVTPWSEVADAVAVWDGGTTDQTYGTTELGPNYDGVSSYAPGGASRYPDGFDTDAASDWVRNDFDLAGIDGYTGSITLGEAYNTPGAPNEIYVPPPEQCGDPYTPIYEVQGNGASSPLVGTEVSVEGIVVGDFQNNGEVDNGDLGGFHVQDPAGDGDVATSDGVFAYGSAIDVSVGDGVRVRGTVSEYYGLTEINITQVWVCSSGNELPAPAPLSLPVAESLDEFEPYEGMLVTFPQALVISEYYNYDYRGEIVLTSVRQNTPTAVVEPGEDAIALAAANALDRITLDDGLSASNPDSVRHPNGEAFSLDNRFRGGDTVANVTGVIDYTRGLYRVQPTQGADYVSVNPRTESPDDVGDSNVRVASFNVLNYFTTIDTGDWICGPSQDMECRGADSEEEFTRQRAKIVAALQAIEADVVGLIEIENHPGDVPTADLVAGLNDVMGAGTYDYIVTGAIGTDAIRQALIYKPGAVTPQGAFAILDSTVDARFLDDYNRPVLAQTFMDNADGGIFTVAVNHLKSKGSDCNAIGDPDLGDGAGNCNLTRKAAAEALVDWLATDPTGSGDDDFLIIGDLNSYDWEDPIDVLLAGGYTDLIKHYLGEYAYSYVFDGQVGYLDHALAGAGLMDEVTGVTVWHINADEPDLIDYDMTYKPPAQEEIYAPDAYRASDHDPVIAGLDVCDEIAPTFDEISADPDRLWPVNHKYVDVTVTVAVSDNFDPNPTIELVSVESNEPDDGLGDGDTPNDIVIVDDFHFELRAERAGGEDDRIYTITYRVTDACGNWTEDTVTVTVPHDMS